MTMHSPRGSGRWHSLRYACAGFTLAAAMLLFSSQSVEWIGEKAEAGQGNVAATTKHRPITSAYVYDKSGLTFPKSTVSNLDQLNFSFALIKNGKVSGSHWKSIAAYKTFIAANPHITPVLSVGGWGADGFSQAASTEAGRKLFVESALALMEQHGFTGIDIDWEYPGTSAGGIQSSPDDHANLTLLLTDLRTGLDKLTAKDGKARLLGIAVGADNALTSKIDCGVVGKLVDQVNVMTYDMQLSTTSTHHTNLFASSSQYTSSADAAVRDYIAAGIPRNKIMIGAAFYGRAAKTVSKSNNGLYQKATKSATTYYSYATLKAMIESGSSTRYYDETAQAPYLFDGEVFISYDDPQSIMNKGAYVKANGLMGLMCWEYGADANGELLRAMMNGIS